MKKFFIYALLILLSGVRGVYAVLPSGEEEAGGGGTPPRHHNEEVRRALGTFLSDPEVSEDTREVTRGNLLEACPEQTRRIVAALLAYQRARDEEKALTDAAVKRELDKAIALTAFMKQETERLGRVGVDIPFFQMWHDLNTGPAYSGPTFDLEAAASNPAKALTEFNRCITQEGCRKVLETQGEEQIAWAVGVLALVNKKETTPLEALLKPEDPLWGVGLRDKLVTIVGQNRYSKITRELLDERDAPFESLAEENKAFRDAAYLTHRNYESAVSSYERVQRGANPTEVRNALWKSKYEDYAASRGDVGDETLPIEVQLQKAQFSLMAKGYGFLCDNQETLSSVQWAGLWAALQLAEKGEYAPLVTLENTFGGE